MVIVAGILQIQGMYATEYHWLATQGQLPSSPGYETPRIIWQASGPIQQGSYYALMHLKPFASKDAAASGRHSI